MLFAVTWMDLEIVILSEVSQTEKDKYHMISLICGIFRKLYKWELVYKTESQIQKTNLCLPGGKAGWEKDKLGIGINIYTLLYIRQITSKNLLNSTGNSSQYSVMTYMGK